MDVRANTISREHPLRRMFDDLVRRHFFHTAQLPNPALAEYVSALLTDFTCAEHTYRIRNARGRKLEDVVEMLIASNPLLDASSFDREREVRKHIGDFALFFTGLFPEAVASLPRLRPFSIDMFVDYMAAGKESYRVVAAFDLFEYRDEAPLFRQLSTHFEQCVFGLNLVKQELEQLQQGYYARLRSGLDPDG